MRIFLKTVLLVFKIRSIADAHITGWSENDRLLYFMRILFLSCYIIGKRRGYFYQQKHPCLNIF
ncbi:MAG: hypothetical protein A2096_12715 [Spirochaetes bacterium GWF1_41_5]|nr:MAG: hypothetical protein A2096_12715 [Spirochaetes bacterium GWF1_41_5]HBE01319.1 hypothetical protein [Spirochaetia bacterium]